MPFSGRPRSATTPASPREPDIKASSSLVWFRRDLRLADNPALAAAVERGGPATALFVLDDETPGQWAPGGASRWWLHHSLQALDNGLRQRGGRLLLRRGRAQDVVPQVAAESGAKAVFWNRCYEPYAIERDRALKKSLQKSGLEVRSFNASLLREPWEIETGQGEPYKVFTPFWKALRASGPMDTPLPAPGKITAGPDLDSDDLEDWSLLPKKPDWAGGLRDTWSPGEAGARSRLRDFLENGLGGYKSARDRPDLPSTSRLSPHLAWGEIGPRQIWHAVHAHNDGKLDKDSESFLSELAWREFSMHLLFHWPSFPKQSWKTEYGAFPWRDDEESYYAWCEARTGYPIVDAAMRELWNIGWMHNRMRMVVASFLVKDLLIPWQKGEAWFWDTLVDADLANNSASWQWVAGCGADAAPYFRIFNPVKQGETHDPKGDYVRRWLPELEALPDRYIHSPWTAPDAVLEKAGVALGETYPEPIVDHATARKRALEAYEKVKQAR